VKSPFVAVFAPWKSKTTTNLFATESTVSLLYIAAYDAVNVALDQVTFAKSTEATAVLEATPLLVKVLTA